MRAIRVALFCCLQICPRCRKTKEGETPCTVLLEKRRTAFQIRASAVAVTGHQTGKVVYVVNGYNVVLLIYNVESEDMISSLYKVSHWSNCTPAGFCGQK